MVNIALTIEYDGSRYVGWQRQINGLSIQQVLEKVLQELLFEPVTLFGAGRTDAGVHALAQVANFHTQKPLPPENLAFAMNNLLPKDIRIAQVDVMPEDFHARYSAKVKTYRYLISTAKNNSVFVAPYVWQLGKDLDLTAMGQAAQYFVGEHDFAAFSVTGSSVKSSIRMITAVKIEQIKARPCSDWQTVIDPIVIEVTANGFLYKMVRLMVAYLVAIGLKKLEPESIKMLLEQKEPPNIAPAPAQGLMLARIEYPAQQNKVMPTGALGQ